ncbi:hypothetical protein KSB_40800 [Ktedonobacter robiniae]|uniref:Uncharacterized protein n=1 Tax=Ktedonobacter robiniae TaxID=2778365 RepID=A0ABQ3USH4_9CHLR|nr:hypothetical protein KSB_40800 [Ktedonobacter robiniae]
MVKLLSGSNQFLRKQVEIATTEIAHLDLLEIVPHTLVWVEIRSVAWQLL